MSYEPCQADRIEAETQFEAHLHMFLLVHVRFCSDKTCFYAAKEGSTARVEAMRDGKQTSPRVLKPWP